eukprot:NODE_1632_length_1098_cov_466.299137.p1 GENE.NODE_1632_length_1098_cov_466.299137~~NODE_1632_length_1098_cov_466.299137.p1  ORF type:complete len:341 (+),score=120.20 NODE_1632_length_1098_cov_466.299137:3-1025(+)
MGGFAMEWKADRAVGSDNPITLLQFADANTALLLRAHTTTTWLPDLVEAALVRQQLRKVCFNPNRQKLLASFTMAGEAKSLADLQQMGKARGEEWCSLKDAALQFGHRIRRDPKVERSEWAASELSQQQRQYAADSAYFAFLLLQDVEALPELASREYVAPEGVFKVLPGWAEQGVQRRNDGLYCTLCKKEAQHYKTMQVHVDSKLHRKKAGLEVLKSEPPTPAAASVVPRELEEEGIMGGARAGELHCGLCSSGPFNAPEAAWNHIVGAQHQKQKKAAVTQKLTLTPKLYKAGVLLEEGSAKFTCGFCGVGLQDTLTGVQFFIEPFWFPSEVSPPPQSS